MIRTAGPDMKASMARDFERGGRTELEALTGALVRLADSRGVDVPATRTAYAILKLRERVRQRDGAKFSLKAFHVDLLSTLTAADFRLGKAYGLGRALADTTVAAAEAAQAVVEARAAKMLLRAPSTGVVAILVAEIGEAVVPGEPVLTMVPDDGLWFGFNLREDTLRGLTIGTPVSVQSASAETVNAKVTELRDWGEFATWRAARATGDHDLNTFFVRLDPVAPVSGWAPGQTVWMNTVAAKHATERPR